MKTKPWIFLSSSTSIMRWPTASFGLSYSGRFPLLACRHADRQVVEYGQDALVRELSLALQRGHWVAQAISSSDFRHGSSGS
jgi:hypothetical protein